MQQEIVAMESTPQRLVWIEASSGANVTTACDVVGPLPKRTQLSETSAWETAAMELRTGSLVHEEAENTHASIETNVSAQIGEGTPILTLSSTAILSSEPNHCSSECVVQPSTLPPLIMSRTDVIIVLVFKLDGHMQVTDCVIIGCNYVVLFVVK